MKAVDYLKERSRTCAFHQYCIDCPISNLISNTSLSCKEYEEIHPEEVVAIIEQWAKENPIKTYLSVLLEMFPRVALVEDGTPPICPQNLFGGKKWDKCNSSTSGGCEFCWNREYKEE